MLYPYTPSQAVLASVQTWTGGGGSTGQGGCALSVIPLVGGVLCGAESTAKGFLDDLGLGALGDSVFGVVDSTVGGIAGEVFDIGGYLAAFI